MHVIQCDTAPHPQVYQQHNVEPPCQGSPSELPQREEFMGVPVGLSGQGTCMARKAKCDLEVRNDMQTTGTSTKAGVKIPDALHLVRPVRPLHGALHCLASGCLPA